ncbi:MAG: hypothetical protein ACJ71M_16400 [Nitrososphaeraceae archaeon]
MIGKTSYTSPEYGEMSQKRLSELLRDQFKARPPKRHGDKRQLVFDKTVLDRMLEKYRINIKDIDSGTDGTDVGLDRHLSDGNSDSKTSKNMEENTNNSSKNEEIDRSHTQQNTDQGSVISDNASHVSHVSQALQTSTADRDSSSSSRTAMNTDPDAYWKHGKWREHLQSQQEQENKEDEHPQ